tara:strand:+ start:4737 stop:5666 length:930 start_codon:yes stop_codon:yes gene_type:complete
VLTSTRDTFGATLSRLGHENKNLVALSADLGTATRLEKFRQQHPERFFEIGIAECNMIGIASGLSEHGYKVFISSFASFLTGKYDVIRASVGYSNAPIVMVGTHAGLAIGKDGVTQMGLEDIALMRAIPNMLVLQPSTPMEASQITQYLVETDLKCPAYLRIGRQSTEEVLPSEYQFKFGKGYVVREGSDVTLFASGCILSEVLQAVGFLESKQISCRVVNMPTIKPIDENIIIESAQLTKHLISVEDHSVVGGLGSAIADVLVQKYPAKLLKIGVNDCFPESGPPDELWEKYGLSSSQIINKVMQQNA